MQKLNNIFIFVRRQPRWRLITAAAVLVIAGLIWWNSGTKSAGKSPTFAARRGPLDITVLVGGSLQAIESQEIKCEVKVGYQGTKILKIIEEGYFVTEEDVKTNKILVELDSSDLQKQIVQQEIQYQSALANLTDAQQSYEIQLGQNDSDIKTAEQKARFARMDFDKLLGDTVTTQIVKEAHLDELLALVNSNNATQNANSEKLAADPPAADRPSVGPAVNTPTEVKPAADTKGATLQPIKFTESKPLVKAPNDKMENVKIEMPNPDASAAAAPHPSNGAPKMVPDSASPDVSAPLPALEMPSMTLIDFSKYADIDLLGDGESKQQMRKFEDDLQVAQKELGQATTALDGTRRLFDKGFVAKNEITRDEITAESARLKVSTAGTAQALYIKYAFPRAAEESLSKYAEGVRELDKARRVAISKLAQATAKLNSAKGQYEVQSRQRKDLNDQLDKCTLSAKKSGLVVYGSGRDDNYGNQEPMREGATVRERQTIITIPDMTRMSVIVKIHESYIKKVKKGQKARITVDAFADQPLNGEITKVSVLPDSQNRWMNPDLKVYPTTVTIDGTHEWVKPGMSTKVEVMVNRLEDVVYVPMQAIAPEAGKQYCYVMNGFKTDRREVEIGDFTDEFIEIKKGVKEGERVLLRPPSTTESDSTAPNSEKDKDGKTPETKPETKPKEPAPAAVAVDPATRAGKT